MAHLICTDCGGKYVTVSAALRHAQRLAFPVRFALVPVPAAPVTHIHQGGTLNTYCGQPLRLDDRHTNVSWEQVDLANCDDCLGSYISAPVA